jgi:hypothetical protein
LSRAAAASRELILQFRKLYRLFPILSIFFRGHAWTGWDRPFAGERFNVVDLQPPAPPAVGLAAGVSHDFVFDKRWPLALCEGCNPAARNEVFIREQAAIVSIAEEMSPIAPPAAS